MVEAGIVLEDERLEILDGEIVEMSPKGYRHEGLKGAINRLWGRSCPAGFDFLPETGLYLSEHTYLEPDFVVFRAEVPLSELKGPDVLLAVEVADSSLAYDLKLKPSIYASFGVSELWVLDAARRVAHVHQDVSETGYRNIRVASADEPLEPVHAPRELAFALADLRRD
jgi:Uma2 family endonuclease